jgi:hypothetical protein
MLFSQGARGMDEINDENVRKIKKIQVHNSRKQKYLIS